MEESYDYYLDVKPPELKCPNHPDEKVVGILEESLELFCSHDLMDISQKKLAFCSINQLLAALVTQIRQNHQSINCSAQDLEVSRRQEKIINTFINYARAQKEAAEKTKSDLITPQSKEILVQVQDAILAADFKKVRLLLKKSEDLQMTNSDQAKRDREIKTLYDFIRQRVGDEERWGIIFAGLDYLNNNIAATSPAPSAPQSAAPGWTFSDQKLDTAVTLAYQLSANNQVITRIEGIAATCIAPTPIARNKKVVVSFYIRKFTQGSDYTVGLVIGIQNEMLSAATQKIVFGPSGVICNSDTLVEAQIIEQGDVIEFHIIQRDDNQAKVHIFKNLDPICVSAFTSFNGRLIPAASMAQIGDQCEIS